MKMWWKVFVFLLFLNLVNCLTLSNYTVTQKHRQGTKYTSEELLTKRFPRKISNDVDLDPCKAGNIFGIMKHMLLLKMSLKLYMKTREHILKIVLKFLNVF